MYRRSRLIGGRGRRRPFLIALITLLVVSVGVWGIRTIWSSGLTAATGAESPLQETPPLASSFAQRPEQRRVESPPPAAQQPTVRMGEQTVTAITPQKETKPFVEVPVKEPATPVTQPVAPPPVAVPLPEPPQQSTSRTNERVQAGMDLFKANRPVEARKALTRALDSGTLSRSEATSVRKTLGEISELLVFSPGIVSGDPFAFGYSVSSGDTLSRITSRENANVDWRFIQRINRIARPEHIRVGQNLKLTRGPFHVVVYKRDYRMDVYLGEGDDRVFVRSFRVGLGEYDSTPVGTFRVRQNSKLINPEWVNPRTGQRFLPDDPANPIGERWIGLEGVSENIRDLGGYGIHGTIEPDSIGTQSSMGCIRMLPDDVELLYEMLVEGKSIVVVRE